jgi:hypothetical protein
MEGGRIAPLIPFFGRGYGGERSGFPHLVILVYISLVLRLVLGIAGSLDKQGFAKTYYEKYPTDYEIYPTKRG